MMLLQPASDQLRAKVQLVEDGLAPLTKGMTLAAKSTTLPVVGLSRYNMLASTYADVHIPGYFPCRTVPAL